VSLYVASVVHTVGKLLESVREVISEELSTSMTRKEYLAKWYENLTPRMNNAVVLLSEALMDKEIEDKRNRAMKMRMRLDKQEEECAKVEKLLEKSRLRCQSLDAEGRSWIEAIKKGKECIVSLKRDHSYQEEEICRLQYEMGEMK